MKSKMYDLKPNLQLFAEDPDEGDSSEGDGLTSLLGGLDEEDPGTSGETKPDDEKKPKEIPKPTDNSKEVASLTESNKNLQEQVRQLSEKNKEFSGFIDRVKGIPNTDKEKEEQVKILRQFEEDPIAVINMLVAQKLTEVDEKVTKSEVNNTIDRAMREIDKEYEIDWEKNYQKIIPLLNEFDKETRMRNPKDILVKAARLAGVIKKRDKSAPPYVEGEGTGVGGEKKTSEADNIKKGILNAGKKSDNLFGI